MYISKIITHSGPAHRDDFLALCVVLAVYAENKSLTDPMPVIYRCEPTQLDLEDHDVWVIDTGGELAYSRHNFDHHQLNPKNSRCALSYVLNAKEIELVTEFDAVYTWLNVTDINDCRGPAAAAEFIGITKQQLALTASPIERGLLTELGQRGCVTSGEWLYHAMTSLGQGLINYASRVAGRLDWLTHTAKVVDVDGYVGIVVPRPEMGLEDPAMCMDQFRAKHAPLAAFSVTPDPRGPGYSLYRYDDHPMVDFSVLEGQPGVAFAHKGGFYATTPSLDIEEALDLVRRGIKH